MRILYGFTVPVLGGGTGTTMSTDTLLTLTTGIGFAKQPHHILLLPGCTGAAVWFPRRKICIIVVEYRLLFTEKDQG